MYEKLKGKKLLILGANPSEKSIIDRAREMGVYTIVTDCYTDHKISPSKDYADEYWDISWSDIDMLEKACRENHIDGVTAGYSEFRIENLIKLCKRLGLPCYCNEEQLETTRDKLKFKEACRKYNVPVIKEYASVDEVDEFPVIVKPVDRAGSIGISIASNNAELQLAYDYAMKMSICKQVIIEKFIENGIKFDVYYAVQDGEIIELSSCDTINAKENGRERVVQSCWLYPSIYHGAFVEKCDESIRNMIKGLGIKFGCIFFSGFVNRNNEFSFFECGFRLEGAHQYKYTEKRGIYDFNDLFIIHALTGSTDLLNRQYIINENLKCAVVNLYAKKGTLSTISGMEEVRKLKNCDMALLRAYIGEKCDDGNAILTKLAQFEISSESLDEIADSIKMAYEIIKFIDENNTDMIYDRVDIDVIRNWYSEANTN